MHGARALLPVALGAALLVGGPLAAGASARAAAPTALQVRTVAPALAPASPRSLPLLFGHRGAPDSLPEHTLAGYELALQHGADVVETDLVATRDHVLVARHDVEISRTTDVASHPEFADRRTTRTVDGTPMTGWFVEDFTLDELRTLRAVERLPELRPDSSAADGLHPVPTFAEVLELVRDAASRYGRPVAVAAETKHPTYHDGIGLSLEEPLVADLRAAGLDDDPGRVYVQSFEEANLRELRPVLPVRLVQLTLSGRTARPYDHVVSGDPTTYAAMSTRAGLREVAEYADVLGPSKVQVLPRTATNLAGPRRLVRDAHRAGLAVVPWTFRAENSFLAPRYRRGTDPAARGDLAAELRDAFRSGVDGVLTDSPDLAAAARRALVPHLRRTARSATS